jgi:ribonucleoside-diphosphate reductase alpha chain
MKSPNGAVTRTEMTALEQLDYWLLFQRHWCEHKPSVTISVKENEWMDVGAWVYRNFDEVSGISFLPFSEHTYQQAPYQDISEEEYNKLIKKMPSRIDWGMLKEFEKEDTTTGSKDLACVAGACEIVDIEGR